MILIQEEHLSGMRKMNLSLFENKSDYSLEETSCLQDGDILIKHIENQLIIAVH